MFDKFDVGPNAFSAYGYSSDKIRWSGTPNTGIKFQRSDIIAIPLSFLWCGFAIFWESMAFRGNAPFFFRLWGVPFVLFGLYMVAGRFFWDAYVRANTAYALTDDSALILRRGFGGGISVVNLPNIANIDLELSPDGSGTISFGGVPNPWQGSWFGQSRGPVIPQFRYIPAAAAVFERCKAAQGKREA
jgi:hypothetical protein